MMPIPTLYVRDPETYLVTPAVTPGCEWVLAGEGIPTRKWDGVPILLSHGHSGEELVWRRHRVRAGCEPPAMWLPAGTDTREYGWVPAGTGPADRVLRGVLARRSPEARRSYPDGTFELVGPSINGNPEGVAEHVLLPHGAHVLEDVPWEFEALRDWLAAHPIEGIVWWHWKQPWVRAKLKRRDFGLPWPAENVVQNDGD